MERFKPSFKGFPNSLKALRIRTRKVEVPEKKPGPVAEPVFEVEASAVKGSGTGLTPPPAALAAPWVVREEVTLDKPIAGSSASAAGVPDTQQLRRREKPAVTGSNSAEQTPQHSAASQSTQQNAQLPAASGCRRPQTAQKSSRRTSVEPHAEEPASPTTQPRQKLAALKLPATGHRDIDLASHLTVAESGNPAKPTSQPAAVHRQEPQAPATSAYRLPPAIQIERFLPRQASRGYTDSEAGTPLSTDSTAALESESSTGTTVVNQPHRATVSLSLTASIEDYSKKANPANWGPPIFRKSQFVRVQPGTYPVPFKKLSESRSQYTSLDAGTKGKIHQINKETVTRDPREFVADEGLVLYRVWIPRKVNSTVEFIFVAEDQMTLYHECAVCNAYATEQCGGCRKEWYCSEECAVEDWRSHKGYCSHKGKTAPGLGGQALDSERSTTETSVSGISPRPGGVGPRRKFRQDGTVKIINAYKPRPEETRGTVRIIPACLRPLTDEEEEAPPPETRTGRCIRAATFRLRRALHRNRPRGQHASEASAEEKQHVTEEDSGLQNDSIPEGEEGEESSDADQDKEKDSSEDKDGSEDGDDGGPTSGDAPEKGDTDAGDLPEPDSSDKHGSSSDKQKHSSAGNRPDSKAGHSHCGSGQHRSQQEGRSAGEGDRSHGGGGSDRPSGSRAHKGGLGTSKAEIVDALAPMQDGGARVSHGASFHALDRMANLSSVEADASHGIASGGSSSLADALDSPGAEVSDADSLGAESLVEGQVPRRRERRSQVVAPQRSQVDMPQLPRIRVRAEAPVPEVKPSGLTENFPIAKEAMPWPIASVASLGKSPKRKRSSPKARHPRIDSLPEVFKRLTTSSKFASLGVRVNLNKDGSKSPTKKTANSPFKRHHPGHRVTLLSSPPA